MYYSIRTFRNVIKWNVNTINGLWIRWRKGLTGPPGRLLMMLIIRAPQVPPSTNEVKTKGHIVIPCTQGLCESIKKICGMYGIQTHFKGSSTIKNLLVYPKEKTPWSAKMGSYIGSNVVTSPVMMNTQGKPPGLGERFKEHLKDPSPIHHHSNNAGHPTSHNNFQIIGRGHGLARYTKESIYIRVNNPTLNRNIGMFNLPHIWDRDLLNTPGLTLKWHAQAVGHANPNTPY